MIGNGDREAFRRLALAAYKARSITRATYLVAQALLRRANRHGRCWPSLETISDDAGCCARTVSNAISSLRLLGILDWENRRVGRFRRTSNEYRLGPVPKIDHSFYSSPAIVADHQPTRELSSALHRLAGVMGVSIDRLPDWLTAPAAPRPG